MLSYNYFHSFLLAANNPQNIQALASKIGPYGIAAVISSQFAQVLIAPLPPVIPVVSGLLYGVNEGVLYSFIGASLGSLAAILIAKKYGRSMVEGFLSDEALEKFDVYTSGHGFLPFIILFTFPGFPDDVLCFIAGLTKLDWKKLFFIASIGRLPGIAMLAVTGSSIAEANTTNFLLMSSAIAGVSYISVRYEQEIEDAVAEIAEEGLSIISKIPTGRF